MMRRLQLLLIAAILLVAAFSTGLDFLFYLVYLAILVIGGSYILTRLGLADLEAGYGDAAETVRRAIGVRNLFSDTAIVSPSIRLTCSMT